MPNLQNDINYHLGAIQQQIKSLVEKVDSRHEEAQEQHQTILDKLNEVEPIVKEYQKHKPHIEEWIEIRKRVSLTLSVLMFIASGLGAAAYIFIKEIKDWIKGVFS